MKNRIADITDIVKSMVKAIKAIQMYGINHPSSKNFLTPFFNKLTVLLEKQPGCSLKIEQFAIYYDTQKIYEENEKDISIAFRLFRDGIRNLNFSSGITSDEIQLFLRTLSQASRDQDIALCLWEQHFPNIEIYVVEEEETEYEYAVPEITQESIDYDAKLHEIVKRERIDIDAPLPLDFTPEELDLLQSQIRQGSRPMTTAITTLMSFLEHERAPEIVNSLIELLEQCITNGNFYDARRIVHRLRKYPDINPVEKFENEATIMSFGMVVNTASDAVYNEFLAFIGFFSERSIPFLIKLLTQIKRPERLHSLRHRVAYVAQDNPAAVLVYLSSKNREMLVNTIALVGMLNLDNTVDYLKPFVAHADPIVRAEVVLALENKDFPFYISKFMDDEDSSVRIKALQALGRLRYMKIYGTLLRHVKSKAFRELEFAEQREYFNCLVSNGGNTLVRDLKKILFKWVLCGSKTYAPLRKMAAIAIVQSKKEGVLEILAQGSKKRNKDIREACSRALKQL
jgi:hypothetical protein